MKLPWCIEHLMELAAVTEAAYCIRWRDYDNGISMIVLDRKEMEPCQ